MAKYNVTRFYDKEWSGRRGIQSTNAINTFTDRNGDGFLDKNTHDFMGNYEIKYVGLYEGNPVFFRSSAGATILFHSSSPFSSIPSSSTILNILGQSSPPSYHLESHILHPTIDTAQ